MYFVFSFHSTFLNLFVQEINVELCDSVSEFQGREKREITISDANYDRIPEMWYGIQMSSHQQVTFVHYQPRLGIENSFRLTQYTKLSSDGPFSLFAKQIHSSNVS